MSYENSSFTNVQNPLSHKTIMRFFLKPFFPCTIDHFTVVCLVAWPLNEGEAGGDLALIETFPLFLC